jgi:hypothetical protein
MSTTEVQYPQYQQPCQQPQSRGTNGMAIASFVLSLLWMWGLGSLLAVIFAAVSRRQMRESGQNGSGFATAGLVIGIVGLVGAIIITILVIVAAAHTHTCYDSTLGYYSC